MLPVLLSSNFRNYLVKNFHMGKVIDPYVEQRKKMLSKEVLTSRKAKKVIKSYGFSLNQSTVLRVIGNVRKKRSAVASGLPPPPKIQPPKKVKVATFRKLDLLTSKKIQSVSMRWKKSYTYPRVMFLNLLGKKPRKDC